MFLKAKVRVQLPIYPVQASSSLIKSIYTVTGDKELLIYSMNRLQVIFDSVIFLTVLQLDTLSLYHEIMKVLIW